MIWHMAMGWLSRFWRFGNKAVGDSEKCWICGVASPELIAVDVYRCRSCKRVQGEGAANFLRAERHRQIAALPRDERLQRANNTLGEAERALIACDGELAAAVRLAEICVDASDDTRREEAASRLASALLSAGQIEDSLNDTAVALELSLPETRAEIVTRTWPAAAIHADARKAVRHVATLQGRCSDLKAALRSQLSAGAQNA